MESNKKFDVKRTSALAYKFSEFQTMNKLKKMLNLLSLTETTGELAYCYQTYANDEACLCAL